jgi:hypothetical protein
MNNNFGALASQDNERKLQEAERRENSNLKRANRELKKFAITGRITRFLQKSSQNNKLVNEAVNQIQDQQAQASIPQIIIPASKEKDIDVQEPKNFGTTSEVGDFPQGGSYAFKIIPTFTGGTNPQPRIKISYGEVNQAAPTNISSLFDAPSGSVYLNVFFQENGSFENSSIVFGGSLPQNTPTRVSILIGMVTRLTDPPSYIVDLQALLGNIILRRQDICINGDPYVDFALVGNIFPVFNG